MPYLKTRRLNANLHTQYAEPPLPHSYLAQRILAESSSQQKANVRRETEKPFLQNLSNVREKGQKLTREISLRKWLNQIPYSKTLNTSSICIPSLLKYKREENTCETAGFIVLLKQTQLIRMQSDVRLEKRLDHAGPSITH